MRTKGGTVCAQGCPLLGGCRRRGQKWQQDELVEGCREGGCLLQRRVVLSRSLTLGVREGGVEVWLP
jgi:hypothetical protein